MPETSEIRRKTRRAKDLALDKAIEILENPQDFDKETYTQTYLTILKNTVPRSQEITGEDGEAINVSLIKYGDISPVQIPTEGLPTTATPSV